MSQNNETNFTIDVPQKSQGFEATSKVKCAESGETFYKKNSQISYNYFKAFGAGEGCPKNKK